MRKEGRLEEMGVQETVGLCQGQAFDLGLGSRDEKEYKVLPASIDEPFEPTWGRRVAQLRSLPQLPGSQAGSFAKACKLLCLGRIISWNQGRSLTRRQLKADQQGSEVDWASPCVMKGMRLMNVSPSRDRAGVTLLAVTCSSSLSCLLLASNMRPIARFASARSFGTALRTEP